MALSEEELRREALMRMAMPDAMTVDYTPDYDRGSIIEQNPLRLTPPGNDPNHPYNRSQQLYEQDYRKLKQQGGTDQDMPSYLDYIDKMYPDRIEKGPSPTPQAPKSKGYLEKAAEGLYDMLPGAPGTKAALDPFLKRKGLGR